MAFKLRYRASICPPSSIPASPASRAPDAGVDVGGTDGEPLSLSGVVVTGLLTRQPPPPPPSPQPPPPQPLSLSASSSSSRPRFLLALLTSTSRCSLAKHIMMRRGKETDAGELEVEKERGEMKMSERGRDEDLFNVYISLNAA